MKYFLRIFIFLTGLFLFSVSAQQTVTLKSEATSIKLDAYSAIVPFFQGNTPILNLELERVLNAEGNGKFSVGSNFTMNFTDLKEDVSPSGTNRTGISPFARFYIQGTGLTSGAFVGLFTNLFMDRGLNNTQTDLESKLGIAPGVAFGYRYNFGKIVFQSGIGYGLNVMYKTGYFKTITETSLLKVGISF